MKSFSLDIRGRLLSFSSPLVMGILNVTPDSFFGGSRTLSPGNESHIAEKAAELLDQGADIIDVGGCSTRPGAPEVSLEEELRRIEAGVKAVRALSADVPVSVDTYRSEVALRAVGEWGADIVNDISAGLLDPAMIPAVASLKAPYIMMHMRGTPATMGNLTDYPDGVVTGEASELRERVVVCRQAGIADIVIDPGFGFAKNPSQNYALMAGLPALSSLLDELPLLVGISRKSMIYKPLGLTPADALPGTDALNTLALERGAAILRVHDVAAARQVVAVWEMFRRNSCLNPESPEQP